MKNASLLSDFLEALGVPHTRGYADRCFGTMTFKSLFGFAKALEGFGVESRALSLGDKAADLPRLPVPFLAATPDGFAIVLDVTPDKVDVRTFEGPKTLTRKEFIDRWTGTVLLASPKDNACEPELGKHRFLEDAYAAKKWLIVLSAAFIFVSLFVVKGIYAHASTVMLTLIDIAGLFVTYHLLLKSLNIHSATGDSICGLIDRSGCHTVLNTSASSFFGLFSWSEVGLAYFSVSLAVLLLFPEYTGSLALINACCCPFSFWSVWYQKYRAKAWCTLCLITQACLWLSLACYIFGGWFRDAFPLGIEFFIIGAAYVLALFSLNAATTYFTAHEKN